MDPNQARLKSKKSLKRLLTRLIMLDFKNDIPSGDFVQY